MDVWRQILVVIVNNVIMICQCCSTCCADVHRNLLKKKKTPILGRLSKKKLILEPNTRQWSYRSKQCCYDYEVGKHERRVIASCNACVTPFPSSSLFKQCDYGLKHKCRVIKTIMHVKHDLRVSLLNNVVVIMMRGETSWQACDKNRGQRGHNSRSEKSDERGQDGSRQGWRRRIRSDPAATHVEG